MICGSVVCSLVCLFGLFACLFVGSCEQPEWPTDPAFCPGSRLLPVRALLAILSMGHLHNTRLRKKSRHIGMDYTNHGHTFYYDSLPDDFYLAEQKDNITRLRKYKAKRLVQKGCFQTMLVQMKD
jgi:hypothetical protein